VYTAGVSVYTHYELRVCACLYSTHVCICVCLSVVSIDMEETEGARVEAPLHTERCVCVCV